MGWLGTRFPNLHDALGGQNRSQVGQFPLYFSVRPLGDAARNVSPVAFRRRFRAPLGGLVWPAPKLVKVYNPAACPQRRLVAPSVPVFDCREALQQQRLGLFIALLCG